MIKIKDLSYRSLWYKKNYYYLKSGQSLSNSTKIASDCLDTTQIHQEIDDGLKLSDILSGVDFDKYFSKTEISFIKVAEKTGNLENIFLSLSQLLKDQHIQKQKVINAFIYPALVLCMSAGLLMLILFIIIPKISPLFRDLKNLPITTRFIMFLSEHLVNYWYMDLFALFTLSFIFIYFKDNNLIVSIKNKVKNLFLTKIVYIKDIYFYWHTEKWLKIIHMSINSNMPITTALLFGYESVNNKYLRKEFEKIHISVNNGNTCASSLKLLDKNLYSKIKDWESIIDSGERTGRFDEVFEICHSNINENLTNSFDRFQRMIEPLLIIFVGIMVLIICVSIILPMYQLTQSLQ